MTERGSTLFLLSRLESELNRLFNEFFRAAESGRKLNGWSPNVDVVELDDAIELLFEVPGVSIDDLKVEVAGHEVRVEGSKRSQLPSGSDLRFRQVESGQARFRRVIDVLQPVNGARAEAFLEDGLLRVRLPKVDDQRQRIVAIEVVSRNDKTSPDSKLSQSLPDPDSSGSGS